MTRRWLGSADVEVDDATGAVLVRSDPDSGAPSTASPTSLAGGTKLIATAGAAEQLVETATPCQFVWLGARVSDDGIPQNTGPCFVGDSVEQHLPILMANYEGMFLRIDDASKLYVRAVHAGDGVVFHVFA